jgi:hypothetical protein
VGRRLLKLHARHLVRARFATPTFDEERDFAGLEYMNSATVVPVIASVKKLDAVASSLSVVFSDAGWQRTHV